ncbi:hypothetical protein [Oricola sp.]|uniref:hypothetical protein n=1 Tax=Oricola sp. TaxID=1979950 RepID=UPI003BACE69F
MTLEEKIALLRDAIINHKQVTGLCNDLPREFCPHILGPGLRSWTTLVWQFGGTSNKGLPDEGAWRCFELGDLDQLASREGEWHRGFHSGRGEQRCVKRIDTAIDADHSAEFRETYRGRIRQRGLQPPRRRKMCW